jgi:hypothetical protein
LSDGAVAVAAAAVVAAFSSLLPPPPHAAATAVTNDKVINKANKRFINSSFILVFKLLIRYL